MNLARIVHVSGILYCNGARDFYHESPRLLYYSSLDGTVSRRDRWAFAQVMRFRHADIFFTESKIEREWRRCRGANRLCCVVGRFFRRLHMSLDADFPLEDDHISLLQLVVFSVVVVLFILIPSCCSSPIAKGKRE